MTSSMFRQTVVLPHECSCVRVCVGFAVGGVATPGAGAATTQLKLQLLAPVSCLLSPLSPLLWPGQCLGHLAQPRAVHPAQ